MVDRFIRRWRLSLSSLAIVMLVSVPVLFLQGTADQRGSDYSYLPQMVMVYETNGPNVNGVQTREVRRLEYRSRTHWIETVIEAQSIDVKSGDFQGAYYNVGSYRQLKGRELTEYHVFSNFYREETLEPTATVLPRAAIRPYSLDQLDQHLGIELTPGSTSATVCYRDECRENAPGLLYISENGQEQVFAEDRRWDIPLRLGDSFFVVRELRVEAEKP